MPATSWSRAARRRAGRASSRTCDRPATILHLYGHGRVEGIYLEGLGRQPNAIDIEALRGVLSLEGVASRLQVVVLNACVSDQQAQLLAEGVPFVVGTHRPVTDTAAIGFSTGFYTRLALGLSL